MPMVIILSSAETDQVRGPSHEAPGLASLQPIALLDGTFYLGVETLIDELITHNKQFSMLAYPNRSHSINEGRNTTRHLFESLTRYLRTHTPP